MHEIFFIFPPCHSNWLRKCALFPHRRESSVGLLYEYVRTQNAIEGVFEPSNAVAMCHCQSIALMNLLIEAQSKRQKLNKTLNSRAFTQALFINHRIGLETLTNIAPYFTASKNPQAMAWIRRRLGRNIFSESFNKNPQGIHESRAIFQLGSLALKHDFSKLEGSWNIHIRN